MFLLPAAALAVLLTALLAFTPTTAGPLQAGDRPQQDIAQAREAAPPAPPTPSPAAGPAATPVALTGWLSIIWRDAQGVRADHGR